MSVPVLSIIVGTRNRPAELRRLIQSIESYTSVAWEMILADASDLAIEDVGLPSNIRIIPERPRRGFARGYNAACRETRGLYSLILNDDCEVLPGYASEAVAFMEANPQIGLGALPYSNRGGPFMVNHHEGMIYGNFSILSTQLGHQIGWHDEEIEMYGADNSLTFRVLLAGFGVAEIPNARILHHETRDQHRTENNDYAYRHQQADLLRKKYEPHLATMRDVYERARSIPA